MVEIAELMDTKKEKVRLVAVVEPELFEEFKKFAQEENRTPGNLCTTLIKEYVKNRKTKS